MHAALLRDLGRREEAIAAYDEARAIFAELGEERAAADCLGERTTLCATSAVSRKPLPATARPRPYTRAWDER